MSQLRALKQETQSDFARQILESAERDGSAPGAMQRALSGLGFAPVGLLAASAVTSVASTASAGGAATAGGVWVASSLGLLAVVKWVGVGLLSSLAVLGSANWVLRAAEPAAPVPSAAVVTNAPPPLPLPVAARPEPRAPESEAKPSEPSSSVTPSPESPESPEPAAVAESSMAQLTALAAIRSALTAQQPSKALALLDDFSRRYPGSTLAEESSVLRIEAQHALGRTAEAREQGRAFLRQRPASVYGPRLRTLLEIP